MTFLLAVFIVVAWAVKIQARYKELAASAPAARHDAERAIDDALTKAKHDNR